MTPPVGAAPLRFDLSADLSATEPPEAHGARRDSVRLLASWRRTGEVAHHRFADLPELLAPGDVVVVNTSGTLAAAVPAERAGGERLELHVSTRLPGAPAAPPGAEPWVVELRTPLPGPCIVEEYDSTCLVPPDWTARLDGHGNIAITRSES